MSLSLTTCLCNLHRHTPHTILQNTLFLYLYIYDLPIRMKKNTGKALICNNANYMICLQPSESPVATNALHKHACIRARNNTFLCTNSIKNYWACFFTRYICIIRQHLAPCINKCQGALHLENEWTRDRTSVSEHRSTDTHVLLPPVHPVASWEPAHTTQQQQQLQQQQCILF